MATDTPRRKDLQQLVRKVPFDIAEPMVPARRGICEDGRPVVLYVDYAIPPGAKPGLYSGTVEIRSGRDTAEVPVELEVYAATLPEKQQLSITNWFDIDRVAERHGVRMWSEPFWKILRKYARLMAAHGQTMFWIQPCVFGLKVANGKVLMNSDRVERYIRLFLSEGLTQIEGPHISSRHALKDEATFLHWAREYEDMLAWAGSCRGDLPKEKKAKFLGPIATSPEGHALLRQWLTPLWELLVKHGWQEKYYQHVFDEPLPEQANEYRHLCLIVRQLMPGVKLMDAVHIEGVNGANDLIVPSYLGGPKRERSFADENRKLGVETWYYTCCGPRGTWLNRFIDYPLIKTRLLHWYNYLTRTSGYLHWGLNMYRVGQDPWTHTLPEHGDVIPEGLCMLPPGDTHIVWPGENAAYGSMRFMAMRNGIEDYELLAMIRDEQKRGRRAQGIIDKVIVNAFTYTQDLAEFDRCRRRLLKLASS